MSLHIISKILPETGPLVGVLDGWQLGFSVGVKLSRKEGYAVGNGVGCIDGDS